MLIKYLLKDRGAFELLWQIGGQEKNIPKLCSWPKKPSINVLEFFFICIHYPHKNSNFCWCTKIFNLTSLGDFSHKNFLKFCLKLWFASNKCKMGTLVIKISLNFVLNFDLHLTNVRCDVFNDTTQGFLCCTTSPYTYFFKKICYPCI